MKILFDQGVPVPLRSYLSNHIIDTAYEQGWSNLKNGELLDVIEKEKFDLLITTDQNLRYQQNLKNREISVVVLMSTSWLRIEKKVDEIESVINKITSGDYIEISV